MKPLILWNFSTTGGPVMGQGINDACPIFSAEE
jgi:hypothetical protein